MKIYLSGPIRGHADYRVAFNRTEKELRRRGHTVMNPAVLSEGFSYEEYMKICRVMLEVCDAIFMMPGWKNSEGACQEHSWATNDFDMPVFDDMSNVGNRLTQSELAICRVLGAKWVSRSLQDSAYSDEVWLWSRKPKWDGHLWDESDEYNIAMVNSKKFPSIRPGDCVCVEYES